MEFTAHQHSPKTPNPAIGAMKATPPETHDVEAAVPAAPAAVAAIRLAEAVAAVAAAVAATAATAAEKLKAENPKAVAEKVEEEKKHVAAAAAAVSAAAAAALVAAEEQKQKEDPRPRVFVRKVYGILSLQFVLTAAVFATACLVSPIIPRFFADDGAPAAVWPMFTVILVSPLIVMFPMLDSSEKKRRRNHVLLALFTLCCSFSIALSPATITVDIAVLQVTILTVLGLTLFTIWGAKTGYDFINIYSCLLTGITMTLLYIIIEVPFPLKMVGIAICVFLVTLVLSGFVVVVYICDIDDKNLSDYYNGGGISNEEDDSGSLGAQRV